MECTTCDREFEYGYIFCPYCGIELEDMEKQRNDNID